MIDPKGWDALMERARRESHVTGTRRRVVGVRAGRRGDGWVYVVQCGPECGICER